MEPIHIKTCNVAELESAPNLSELLAEYGAESSIAGLGQPAAQFDMYRTLEQSGLFHMLGAYKGDTLVGFLLMVVSMLPHYGARVATTESFFVSGPYRNTGAGTKLRQEAERYAKELGAIGFLISAPKGGKLAEVLDAHKAYQETNRIFFRTLV